MTNDSEIINSFKELDGQKASVGDSTKSTVMAVFVAYPTTAFTQKDFATKLGKRTQFINHILRDLVGKGMIVRVGSPSQYFYMLDKATKVVKTTK